VNVPDATLWAIAAAALVMLALCGFALLVSGFSRAQNVIHTFVAVIVLYSVGIVAYWAVGSSVQWHGTSFLRYLVTTSVGETAPELWRLPLLAQVAAFAAVIPLGALAERWRFSSMIVVGALVATTVQPLVARWIWAGGWLAGLGASSHLGHGVIDFSGSGVVHLVGGMVALAGAMAVGSRTGKFTHNGRPTAMPGHHVPMFMAGSLMVGVGWFGFVIGMGLPLAAPPLASAAASTTIAPAASVLAATAYMMWRFGTPDPSLVANAWLAGLVSISAGSAFVSGLSAVLIGIVSGPLVIESVLFVERRRVDDLAGVVSVHGVCGAWGLLAAGLLAGGQYGEGLNGVAGPVQGLFYGDGAQLVAQAIGVIVVAVFAFVTSYVVFQVVDRAAGNRVALHAEREGLDVAELGAAAYPDFVVAGPHDSAQ
jgi:ammonium transporter, Amt family